MDITEFKRLKSTQNINRHPWELTRARIARFLLKEHKVPCEGIADVGSGDGFVLKYLIDSYTNSSFAAVDHAYTAEIIEAIKAEDPENLIHFFDTPEKAFAWKQFSCILLMDVIEHIEDDAAFMKKLVNATNSQQNAHFLITVPAFQFLFSKHDSLLLHYRRYNVNRLASLCQQNNLKIITNGYFFFSLVPVRLIQLFAEKIKIRKPTKAAENWERGRFTSRIISFILWADFRICYSLNKINIRMPGLSCYCICQKSA